MAKRKISEEQKQHYDELFSSLKNNKVVLKMKKFKHHRSFTAYDHSVSVAEACYKHALNSRFNYDIDALIVGAMLHDLYLYDWHDGEKNHRHHGFVHPELALGNAEKYFDINMKEKDIILHHMWPLTLTRIPKCKEAFLVSYYDKVVGIKEVSKSRRKMIRRSRVAFETESNKPNK